MKRLSLLNKMEFIEKASSDEAAVKLFDGIHWTHCSFNDLRQNVLLVSAFIQNLRSDGRGAVGFYVEPFLGLPALVGGAVMSSCPFIFLTDEKFSSPKFCNLLNKLGVRWILSDHLLHHENLQVLGTEFTLCGTVLHLYKNPGASLYREENYLYGITTSGSTGEPKVVRVPEASLLPNILDFSAQMKLTSNDVILLSSALTFDPSMVELFLAIHNQATLVLVSKGIKGCPKMIHKAIVEGEVTFYQTTPSLFRLWSADLKRRLLSEESSMRVLVLGGEPFPRRTELKTWDPGPKIKIFNAYGITEVSCWAFLKLVWPDPDDSSSPNEVDIGQILSETVFETEEDEETRFHHLLIGSVTRTCAINDESFEELRGSKTIMRPTGDMFTIKNGRFVFSHRKDSTVKRLGKKIVLSCVENEAHRLGLDCTLVVTRGKPEDRVVLIIVGRESDSLIRSVHCLKSSIPSDHWPDKIIYVEEMPISQHGKVDKAELIDFIRQPSNQSKQESFEESWSHFTLGHQALVETSNRQRGFIASGGNSFNAVLFVNSLEHRGFNVHPDLLVTLLKDDSFEDCLALFINSVESDDFPTENLVVESVDPSQDHRLPAQTSFTPSMALKGRMWPESFPVDSVWSKDSLEMELEWAKDLLKCVDASPLGVLTDKEGFDGFVIVGSHSGLVITVQLTSGKILSQTQLPNRVEASACLSSDLKSYYIGCYDGRVYRINISDGLISWSFATGDMVKAACCLHEGRIYFGSYDKDVYALTESGDLKWRRSIGPVTVPAVALASRVFFSTLTGRVTILNADNGTVVHDYQIGPPIFSNMSIVPHSAGNCLLIAPVNGLVQWRDIVTFEQVHRFDAESTTFAAPVPLDSAVLIASGNTVHFLRHQICVWNCSFDVRIVSTPFVVANRAVVITIDGQMWILDLNFGGTLGTFRFPGEIFSSPIVVGRRIYVGCRDNNFYCVKVL